MEAALGTLAFYSDFDDFDTWKNALQAQLPQLKVVHASAIDRPEDIHYALVWKPPEGFFQRMPNLRLIINLGAGVDSLVARQDLPKDTPITRITDPNMSRMMAGYVLFAVLRHAREIPFFEAAQRRGEWAYRHPRAPEEITVAVLGLGQLGAMAAHELQRQGFRTLGWSRSPARIEGVECFSGMEALDGVLGQADIVVLMLPLTPLTKKLFDRERLQKMRPGAAFVNVARGALVDQVALTELLHSGQIGAATLDVFEREPLAAGDPLWTLPNVLITPHLASVAIPSSSARQIADNIQRIASGQAPNNTIEPARGY
ncbi:glyoxylate/hydroxypyruvate reductase A [Leptospira sp. 96542]|nr:glyoxylate/hydroxypyruvate reductase A [Leptospira sp. 96542]